MAFIKSKEQLQLYVTIENGVELDRVQPYLNLAEKNLEEAIGKDLLQSLLSSEEDIIKTEAYNYACGIIANTGLSRALNALKLKISNSGVKLASPQQTDNPNWWDVKDLQRDLARNTNEYYNYLLKHFESNKDEFPLWDSAPVQQATKDLLITSLAGFEEYYSLNGSFITFLALRPFIRDAQFFKIKKQLQGCYNSEDLTEQTLKNIKAALVNYTIASVADSGLFKLEENGALVKLELMPWEKTTAISDNRLSNLKEQRNAIAEEYLMEALKDVSKLPCFSGTVPSELISIKKPSMLFVGRARK